MGIVTSPSLNVPPKRYYLYRHIRLDKNEPFYIGIGKVYPGTAYYNRAYSKNYRNKYWSNVVSKTVYNVEILFETDNVIEISQKEKEFILLHGRKDLKTGTLVNMTDGGELTYSFGPEELKRRSEQMKGVSYFRGKVHSEETKEKMRNSHKNRDYSYLKGRKLSKEKIQQLSTINKGNKYNLGKKASQEKRDKISKSKFKMVLQYSVSGEFIKEFNSINEAAKEINSAAASISSVLSGKNKTIKGFIFKYK